MAAEFFCFILPIFSLFSLPIDCVLANILRRFFMDAKLAILQACLKVWKSGGASSKGRGQKSGGRSKDGAKILWNEMIWNEMKWNEMNWNEMAKEKI